MRLLRINLLSLFSLLSLTGAAAPQPDPERPLYQCLVPGLPLTAGKRCGGLWGPVEWPAPPSLTPAQIAAQQAADLARIETAVRGQLMSRGLAFITVGILLLTIGGIMHAVNRSPIVQRVTEWALAIGAGLLLAGLVHWWVYREYRWLMAGISLLVLAGLAAGLYRLRNWGLFGKRGGN
jgi:hypothetical protein